MSRFAIVLALFVAGCGGGCLAAPAPVAPVSGDACEAAGNRLTELGCHEATTPDWTSFATACKDAARDGRDWRADCIAKISTCSDVARAYRTPKGAACAQ